MTRILAALDASDTLEPTARAARSLSALLGAQVAGLHVVPPAAHRAADLEPRAGFEVEVVEATDIVEALRRAMETSDVAVAVVGARDPAGTTPVGHVARRLAEQLTVPLLVVPPGSSLGVDGRVRRALVPLDGDPETSADVGGLVERLASARVEIVLTHVFNTRHVPRFVDEPQHGYDAIRDEFRARNEPLADRVELRRGAAWGAVLSCAGDIAADLIVLSWAQDLGPGRAAVVREAMANPTIPTLLLPHHETSAPPVGG
jgi:nucleotide-binding universal stress UspA family protein